MSENLCAFTVDSNSGCFTRSHHWVPPNPSPVPDYYKEGGFVTDEPYETLGESLALPPFLEPNRAHIESVIRPFDTTR